MSLLPAMTPEQAAWERANYSGLPAGAPPQRIETMDEENDGIDWGSIIQGGTDSFLQIYSTVTQKPIAQRAPNSVMDYIIGTDAGTSTGGIVRQGVGAGTLLLLAGVVVLAIVAMRR